MEGFLAFFPPLRRDVRLTKPRILRCLAIGSFALLKLAKPKGVTLDQLWVDFGGNIVELIRIANEIVKFAFTGLVLNKQTIARSHRLESLLASDRAPPWLH